MVLVLGPVQISVGDRAVELASYKVRSLLALLAMRAGRAVSRERLADELWDEAPPPTVTAALRVHMTSLRRILRDEATGLSVRLGPSGFALERDAGGARPELVDAARAERLLREASGATGPARIAVCTEALALFADEPYANVHLGAVGAERARLVRLQLDLFEAWAQARVLVAPPDAELIARLDDLTERDPCRERFSELLMRALYQVGRESEALAVYQRLRRELAEQLGLVPSEALRQLEDAILRQSPDLAWRPLAGMVRAGPIESRPHPRPEAMVGRDGELAVLDQVWKERRAGASVLVTGDAGIGKSTLVAEFAARREAEGTAVVVGACDPERTIPFRPFIEMSRQIRLAGEGDTASDVADDRLRFFTAVSECFERIGGSSPAGLLLIVEDVHWIDDASAALFRFLVRAHPPLPLLVVTTARSDEPEESLAWSRLRADLARSDSTTTTIVLDGLGPEEVAALSGPTEDSGLLYDLTRGNPLLLDELRVLPEGRLAQLRAGETGSPLPSIVESVRHRLRLLSGPARRSLERAALSGDRAPTELIAAAGDHPEQDVYRHRAEAVDLHLLVDDDDEPGAIVFPHDLVRRAVITAMASSRRRAFHVRLAAELRRSPDFHGRQQAIARHLLEGVPACSVAEAAAASVAAGEAAIVAFAFEQAAAIAERALACRGSGELDAAVLFGLWDVAGRAHAHLGRTEAAGRASEEAAQRARALDDPHLLARAALGGDLPDRPMVTPPARVRLLAEALERLDGHGCGARVRVLSALARDATPGRLTDRRSLARAAVALARERGETSELLGALAAWHVQHLDRPGPETLQVVGEMVRLSEVTGDVAWAGRARLMRARERLVAGDMRGAEQDVAIHRALAESTRRPRDQWQALVTAATLHRVRGRLEEADDAAAAALVRSERFELPEGLLTHGVHLFFSNLHRGTLADARATIERIAETDPVAPRLPHAHLGALLAAMEDGDATAAGPRLPDLDEVQPWDELTPALLALRALALDAGAEGAEGGRARLARALEPLGGTVIVAGGLAGTFGPADRYRSMLARRAGEPEVAIGLARRAVDLSDSMGTTVWGLWSRAELAAALAGPQPGAARELAAQVSERAMAAGLGGPARTAAAVTRAADGRS
jgi:DNA-binding SARP family transcriptional activator/tetratricopeptide (TPR) repeat protein